MVLQVVKDGPKDEEFAEIKLPLPGFAKATNKTPTKDDEVSPSHDEAEYTDFIVKYSFRLSIIMNILLFGTVIVLGVWMVNFKTELDQFKVREEFEITAMKANEHDSYLDLTGYITSDIQLRIQEIMDGDYDGWFRNGEVMFYASFKKREESPSWFW